MIMIMNAICMKTDIYLRQIDILSLHKIDCEFEDERISSLKHVIKIKAIFQNNKLFYEINKFAHWYN